MSQKAGQAKPAAEKVVKEIRRATRKHYSAEEKIRIVLEGLRGEDSIAELCRREGLASNIYYRWSKDFLEAGKKRLAGDVVREATSDEVKGLRQESLALKEAVADLTLENRLLKKSVTGSGDDDA
jgi:transposase